MEPACAEVEGESHVKIMTGKITRVASLSALSLIVVD